MEEPKEHINYIIMDSRPYAQPLVKQTPNSAGYDLANGTSDRIVLYPGKHTLVRTGIVVNIPEGYEIQVRSRSGLAAKHGVMVLNSPGTVDSDYQGEICVIMYNAGVDVFHINPGTRIAQAVVNNLPAVAMIRGVQMDLFVEETERGQNGFGSTGS